MAKMYELEKAPVINLREELISGLAAIVVVALAVWSIAAVRGF
jgi:hypothetical protein